MSAPRTLPTVNQLRALVMRVDCLVAFPALIIMLFYLARLLDISAAEWKFFLAGTVVYSMLSAVALEPIRRRLQTPVRRYLEAQGGPPLEHHAMRAAFSCIMVLPRSMMQLVFGAWIAAGIYFPLFMAIGGFESWLVGDRLFGVTVAALTGGLISMAFMYFTAKRVLTPIRLAIAAELPDPDERRALIRPVTLARKLQFVVAGSGVASLIFTMGVAYDSVGGTLIEIAADYQVVALDALESRIGTRDLADVRAELWPEPSLMPQAIELTVHPRTSLPSSLAEVDEALQAGRVRGEAEGLGHGRVIAWRSLADGRVLVAESAVSLLRAPLAGLRTMLLGVLITSIALSFGISWMLADDVRRTLDGLRADADRMASGDLRAEAMTESEDELGELARAFERMGGALRATVGRVAETADRVDAAAAEIASVSESVATVSADQTRRIAQANGLMENIRAQVGGVATAAQALNESVEESSSSILELGAAGDELSETATVLAERVDDVSTSIEEMVRSVKQVADTSGGLVEAATDTSSSMEEMASAMRAVDTTAAKTAELSRGVVASAESGQAKVSETIEGMHAIHESTAIAEKVIRSLGARTEEIGAILDVIDDVGEETTLLALNAAIIAAQAGEHGRGFSVVADEIKELADRVLSSTKEIGAVIRAVQEEAGNAVGASAEGARAVANGVDLSAAAGISLEEITRSARESGQHIARIVSAVREQTQAASQVAQLMDRVSDGVAEIRAAGADQDRGNEIVFRSSITMREITQQVRRTTEEQSSGFARIRESVESVREAVEQINGSLQEQAQACNQIAGFLDQVAERTNSNEQSVQSMGEATDALVRQAEMLRENVAQFTI